MNKTTKAELTAVMEEYGEIKAKLTAQFFDTDTMTREDFIVAIAIINESAESFLANWEEA